ncbi:hypothetical protein AAHA92_28322 [Salvia divinorum]|uniref:Uncharacterized protein n=1 Tax=Salvia divinorum TaxID=28513 RepID=A0ABD1FUP3_SALDI
MIYFWQNLGGGGRLEPILEIPVPLEMSEAPNSTTSVESLLTRCRAPRHSPEHERHVVEIQFLLGVLGARSLPVFSPHSLNHHEVKTYPVEKLMASYIVQQYVASSGGDALKLIENMSAVGTVKVSMADKRKEEYGGFVLYQQTRIRPAPWSLELMLSGSKVSAGCNGKVAWRQTPWRATCDPAQPLRLSLQGLDPKGITELFSNSISKGERTIDGQDCFLLEVESQPSTSMAETTRHAVKGYFSQKTGLLIHLEDTHLRSEKSDGCELRWVTKTASSIKDYRPIAGVNIAHGGQPNVTVSSGSKMEETWSIEEIDFNVKGMSKDFFAAPADVEESLTDPGVKHRGIGYAEAVGLEAGERRFSTARRGRWCCRPTRPTPPDHTLHTTHTT